MSMPENTTIRCRFCGAEAEITIFQSVNDHWPNVTKVIMTGELFEFICPRCRKKDRLEYDIIFNDFEHKAWIQVVHDPELIQRYIDMMKLTSQYMPETHMRIVRNMNELREKVSVFVRGRDDRIIEIYKFMIYTVAMIEIPDLQLVCNPIYSYNLETGEEYIVLLCKSGEQKIAMIEDAVYNGLKESYAVKLEMETEYFIYDFVWAEAFLKES